MKIASVAAVKASLSSFVKDSGNGPMVVTRNGKAVAVLLGIRDYDELESLLLAHSRKLRSLLDAADRRIQRGEGIGHDQFWEDAKPAKRPNTAAITVKKRMPKRRG